MSNCSYYKSRNGNNNTVRRYKLWLSMFVKVQNGCQYCTNTESKPMWIFVHRQNKKKIYLTMFDSSLPSVVCRRTNVLFTFFVLVCVRWCSTHVLLCLPSSCVLCTQCCQLSELSILDFLFGFL